MDASGRLLKRFAIVTVPFAARAVHTNAKSWGFALLFESATKMSQAFAHSSRQQWSTDCLRLIYLSISSRKGEELKYKVGSTTEPP